MEDINEISKALVNAIQRGNENSEKITELSNMLTMLSESARFSAEKQNESQKEQMITHLPLTISVDRLEELTSKPTHSTIREFILKCYTPDAMEEVVADGSMAPDQGFILVGGQNNQELSSTNLFKELDKNALKNLSITKSEKLEINDNLSLEDL